VYPLSGGFSSAEFVPKFLWEALNCAKVLSDLSAHTRLQDVGCHGENSIGQGWVSRTQESISPAKDVHLGDHVLFIKKLMHTAQGGLPQAFPQIRDR